MTNNKWPKTFPPLTTEQKAISDDFMKHWHEVIGSKYSIVETFNHNYINKFSPKNFISTLEIGAGLGEHLLAEKLTSEQLNNYVALELRQNMADELKSRFPTITTYVGDCQGHLEFSEGHFDRILAIHVLEHLPNLPAAIKEMHRLCNKEKGFFVVIIPCEGGLGYSLARKISAQRIFEKRYKQLYNWFIEREHINKPDEIIQELSEYFEIDCKSFFPLNMMPFVFCNLFIGLTLRPKV